MAINEQARQLDIAGELHAAARAVTEASEHIGRAHAHNGVVWWYETPQGGAENDG